MSFEIKAAKETRVILTGKLDTTTAPPLMDKLNELRGQGIERIVFDCRELTYLSSAGIRVIIFAKQKIGNDVEIIMEGTSDDIKEVIKMVGLDNYIQFIE